MPISTLLNPENILCHVQCQSRKRALQLAAQSIAENDPDRDGLVADEVFAGLVERERLGSTGLGFGVAIPHCRMACQSIHATFMSLEESVDYEALDNEGVDLLFVLVVPKNETHAHLDVLAELGEYVQVCMGFIFRHHQYKQQIHAFVVQCLIVHGLL